VSFVKSTDATSCARQLAPKAAETATARLTHTMVLEGILAAYGSNEETSSANYTAIMLSLTGVSLTPEGWAGGVVGDIGIINSNQYFDSKYVWFLDVRLR